jgi:hypothetical protein
MAEISAPRIESISDQGSGSGSPDAQEQPVPNARVKPAVPAKISPSRVPEISPPAEEDKHDLDEMA